MALPQDDPSLPSNPSPLFSDTDAVRGDHQRANNQYIWENLEYLNDGENINDADAATPIDADKLGFWQIVGGIIKYVTFANLFLWIGTKIAALSTKGTPVDADSVVIVDSENSNVLKRVLFSALKTFFKTYFDGVYSPIILYAKLSDVKGNNVSGGAAAVATWTKRDINTEDIDSGNIVSLSSSALTLQAGTYKIYARSPFYRTERAKIRLQNTTDSSTTLLGSSTFSGSGGGYASADSVIQGQFTIASQKTFEVQYYAESNSSTQALGVETNAGVDEVYTVVEIWKTA